MPRCSRPSFFQRVRRFSARTLTVITMGAAATAVAVSAASGHADAARQALVPAAATNQLLSFMRVTRADGPGAGNGQGHGNGDGHHSGNDQGSGSPGQGPGDHGQGSGGQGPAGQNQGSQGQGQGQGSGDQGQGAQGQGSGAQGNGQGPAGDGRHHRHGHDPGKGNGQGDQAQGTTGDRRNGGSGAHASPQDGTGDSGQNGSTPLPDRHHGDRQHSPRHSRDRGLGSNQAPAPPPATAPAPAPPVVVTPPPATPAPKPAPKHHTAHRHRVTPAHHHVSHPAPSIRRGLAGSLTALGASATSLTTTVAPERESSTGSTAARAITRPKPHSHHSATGGGFTSAIFPAPITRLVKFIPGAVWLALAVSVGLALLGLGAAVFFRRREVRQAGKMAEVETAALTDALTAALNRRGFEQAVERELARSRRYGRPFVLAYADVRGLKGINDSEGHLAGDQLLRAVATVLGESARAHDVIGRLGGDEFALLLPEQSGQDVGTVIERICDHLQAAREELGFQSYWGLTVGAAAFPVDGESFDDLLAVADRRLYEKRGIELLAGAH